MKNTLNASITSRFFKNESGYAELQARWATLMANKKALSPAQHLLYAVLRGRDWRKGFVPVTNQAKLDNGHQEWYARDSALATIHNQYCSAQVYAPFADLLSDEAKALVVELLPTLRTWYGIDTPYAGSAYLVSTEDAS